MPKQIPQLDFDSSSSALVRIDSRALKYNNHYPTGLKVNPNKCGCIKDLENWPCPACDKNDPRIQTSERYVCLGWDVNKQAWCLLFATHKLLSLIIEAGKKKAFTKDEIFAGKGPVFAIQRIGIDYSVEIVETIKPTTEPEDALDPRIKDSKISWQVAKRSVWDKNSIDSVYSRYGDNPDVFPHQLPAFPIRPVSDGVDVLPISLPSFAPSPIFRDFQEERRPRPIPLPVQPPPLKVENPEPSNEEPINLDHLDVDKDLWDSL